MEVIVEHSLKLAGRRTRALELEGEGPPLLLIHGFGDSADSWRLVLDRLRKAGRAAVALDLPGFGAADRLDPKTEVLPQHDAFMDAAVERWAGRRGTVAIAGNSLGGLAAMRAAERNPDRIQSIVPVAPAGLDMPVWFNVIQGAPIVRALLTTPVPVPQAAVRQAIGNAYRVLAFSSPGKADATMVRAFASHYESRRDAARLLETGRRLMPELADPFRLELIRCPVMVVWGTSDRMVFPSGAERISSEVPGTRVELLRGCGHCPQVEEPDRLTELLLDFTAAGVPAAIQAG